MEPIVDFTRTDGWFHFHVGLWDLPRGPLGVLGYLVFVPFFQYLPRSGVRPFLIATSLVLWYATLGPAYVAFLSALILYYLGTTLALTRWTMPRSRGTILAACLLLHLPYVWLLFDPMPTFLPSMGDSLLNLTNYLHWCGLAYVHLKAVCTLIDRIEGRLKIIRPIDYATYMLFAPSFKMGPLYRYEMFISQIDNAHEHVRVLEGLRRIGIGFVRLGVMLYLLTDNVERDFFPAPETMKYYKVVISTVCAPLQLYFWLAGYCDIAIGMGHLMGFRVPEQFRGPWFVNNIADFWKRWHITLGQWLYDYPFRGMMAVRFPHLLCFVLTFLYCGLWHGLLWSYASWGLLQGIGLGVYHIWHRWWSRRKKRNGPVVQRLRALRLCDSRVGWWAAWLLLIGFQFLTISMASDLTYAGTRFVPVLFGLEPLK